MRHYGDMWAGESSRGLGAFPGFPAGQSLALVPTCVLLLNMGLAIALSPAAGGNLHVPHYGLKSPP